MTNYKIEVANDKQGLEKLATKKLSEYLKLVLEQRERAQLSLSGGSTPSNVYKLLSKKELPWDRVDVFLGDERWVDYNDDLSNALMIRKTKQSIAL